MSAERVQAGSARLLTPGLVWKQAGQVGRALCSIAQGELWRLGAPPKQGSRSAKVGAAVGGAGLARLAGSAVSFRARFAGARRCGATVTEIILCACRPNAVPNLNKPAEGAAATAEPARAPVTTSSLAGVCRGSRHRTWSAWKGRDMTIPVASNEAESSAKPIPSILASIAPVALEPDLERVSSSSSSGRCPLGSAPEANLLESTNKSNNSSGPSSSVPRSASVGR